MSEAQPLRQSAAEGTPMGDPTAVGGMGGMSGPRCAVCAGLMDGAAGKENDKQHVEKSTRIVLGLLAHYSDTLMNVLKRGPTSKDGVTGKPDDEESSCSGCMIMTWVAIITALILGAVGMMMGMKKSSSSASFVQKGGEMINGGNEFVEKNAESGKMAIGNGPERQEYGTTGEFTSKLEEKLHQ